MRRWLLAWLLCLVSIPAAAQAPLGSAARPLRVILIPADGGTESGTRADYQPIFNAIARGTRLQFKLTVAQSYGAVVEALCGGQADIAFVGPVTFVQAHKRRCAELLAVATQKGRSVYYAGLFARADGGIRNIGDIRGKRAAFGDINSASSFIFPLAMMMEAKIDPARDLAEIRLTGSHANSLAALAQGRVDVAALSFDSYEKAVRQGAVDPRRFRVVAKSMPIPYPPLVVSSRLPAPLKATLRAAFARIATMPGITPDMIRGYGGKRVDGYDTRYPVARFNIAAARMALVDREVQGRILRKSAQR